MKNLFRFAMAVAILFTASCAKEDISSSIGGGKVEVTFTANLADMGTRAYGEANNVDVVFLGIYDQNGNYLDDLTVDGGYPVDPVSHTASIPVVLLKDKTYDLVFWAQDNDANCYTMYWGERKMSVSYTGAVSQDDTRDAFFLVDNEFVAGEEKNPEFRLYRPFAQLNAGLSADEVTKIGKNGVDVSKIKSQVVVKQVASTLNLLEEATDTAIDVADFVDASFIIALKPEEALKVSDVNYEYLSMNYLLVDTKRNVDVEYLFTDADNTRYARNYYNVPLQRNYRTNIVGNLLSSEYDFNVIIVPGFDGDENLDAKTQIFDVATDAELLAALTTKAEDHIEHIVINLNADVTLDVAANDAKLIGASLTKDITINGIPASRAAEPYTLTFNNTNSDWNHIATKGAKLILNNLNITNSGKNNGPWNRHDINFACDVEMNNVVSDKALAFKAGATLKNTTITEDNASDVYAIWIQPNGQTVTIENCTIDSTDATDGRGIKIDEEYVKNPKKVTLNLSDTSFATEEKAAIIVKSKAGAEINASNLDIANVAADSKYAVWVDEGAAAYYNLVEVTGALVRLEGSTIVSTPQQFNDAVATGGYIYLTEGEYTFNGTQKDITVIGSGNVANIILNQVNKTPACNGKNVNFANVTLKYGNENYKGIQHSGNVSYKNCVIEGQIFLYGTSETFEECVFNVIGNAYNVWTYGCANVTFKNCEFNCDGKSLLVYHEQPLVYNVTIDGCTFTASSNREKAAIQMHTETGISGVLKINDSSATGFEDINNGLWNELNNGSKELTNKFEKYVDGVQVYNELVLVDGAYTIYSAAGLQKFANEVNANGKSFAGKTVKLVNDIDLQNATWTPIGQTGATTFNGVFDGQNYTISNLKVDSSAQTGEYYSSGLFGWVESHTAGHGHIKNVKIAGATITGHHNCGALVGYITQETALVENCHVTGATISCTYATNDTDGDKAGALIGNATVATPVKDCTATNSTVSAGRDAGQLIGAGKAANVTGCSVTNVTVTYAGEGTGANIRNEVIGRLL